MVYDPCALFFVIGVALLLVVDELGDIRRFREEALALPDLLDQHWEHVGRDGLITPSLLRIVFPV